MTGAEANFEANFLFGMVIVGAAAFGWWVQSVAAGVFMFVVLGFTCKIATK